MYKTFDKHWDSESEEHNNSSGDSFWSDHESEVEEESDEELRECYVREEESGGTHQDKSDQLAENAKAGEHDDQGRPQSKGWPSPEHETHAGERRGDEAQTKCDGEKPLQEEDQSKCTGSVKEDYEKDWSNDSEKEQDTADTHGHNGEETPPQETADEDVEPEGNAQAKKYWYGNEDMGNDLEEHNEKDGEQDYPMSAGSPTSVITSGYGTYRPDSPRDNPEGGGYHDDRTLSDPEDDRESQFDAQYYVDNYNLSINDHEYSLTDDKPNGPHRPELCNSHADDDLKCVGLYVANEGLATQCDVDESKEVDEAVGGESQYRDGEVYELKEQCPGGYHTASEVRNVPELNENDFSSLCESHEHPFNLRSNKYYQKGTVDVKLNDHKKTGQKKRGVSGLEQCLDRLQMSGTHRHPDSELESEEMDSGSSVGELPSAFQAYLKGMVRSQSENDIRPRPKSFIRPLMDHPHTRNLKKTDPVTKYFQYKQEWDAFKAPGEKDRRALQWAIREQLMYQPPPPRPQKVLVPNTYVVPTDKKRSALRWEIRHDLANGIIPTKMAFP
ncbi:uncharacterized protein hyls1 isoform X1 [Alosa sapidissima]|uniref:uncharacterized protein hyls1 isoform X1 n=1 Tax=Alosa sapidissima TaxID=34773 RepID=UPI001C088D24|nr:uncharacterized protein hyls1 isoform X1 [Alosa sapidissima]